MITFQARIQRFNKKGEKTGWSFIEISKNLASRLSPGTRRSFRVKGTLDSHPVSNVAVLPMGDGNYLLAINASMRKGTGKQEGDTLKIQLSLDESPQRISTDLMRCLRDEPVAHEFFKSLPKGHQRYFSTWIESARTIETKTRRIAAAVFALSLKQGFGEMLRANKNPRK